MTHPDPQPEPPRLSQILPHLADGTAERLTIAEIVARLQDRAHLALLVLFALPNTLPSIPGTSAITGIPLVYLSLQLALGRKPWLPEAITRRSLSRQGLAQMLQRAQPWMERGERYWHPRLGQLTNSTAQQLVGVLMVILALAVLLPIPFGNMLPSLAIIFFALGLMEEDGVWIIAGSVTMAIGILVFSTLLWALFKAAVFVFLGAFGYAS